MGWFILLISFLKEIVNIVTVDGNSNEISDWFSHKDSHGLIAHKHRQHKKLMESAAIPYEAVPKDWSLGIAYKAINVCWQAICAPNISDTAIKTRIAFHWIYHQLRVIGKDTDKYLRQEDCDCPKRRRINKTADQQKLKCLFYTIRVASPVVKADNRLRTLSQTFAAAALKTVWHWLRLSSRRPQYHRHILIKTY